MKLHHIGYLVKDIQKSMKAFHSIGFVSRSYDSGEEVMYDPERKCDICFLELAECPEHCIELISPQNQDSPIWGLMARYKNTPYHMCFESEHMEQDIQKLGGEGWLVFQGPAAAPAIEGHNVVFLTHRNAGIIELVDIG